VHQRLALLLRRRLLPPLPLLVRLAYWFPNGRLGLRNQSDTGPAPEPKPTGLIPEGDAEIEVTAAPGSSPHVSVQTFEELKLSPDILKGVFAKKFAKPSKVQANAMPLIMRCVW
jgi:hypothetical protein